MTSSFDQLQTILKEIDYDSSLDPARFPAFERIKKTSFTVNSAITQLFEINFGIKNIQYDNVE
jgi:hypothetical protein